MDATNVLITVYVGMHWVLTGLALGASMAGLGWLGFKIARALQHTHHGFHGSTPR